MTDVSADRRSASIFSACDSCHLLKQERGDGEVQEAEADRCQRGVGGRQVEGVKTRMKGLGRRHSGVVSEMERKKNR